MTMHHTDRDLTATIALVRGGDADALGAVYRRYERRVRDHVQRVLADPYEAEDVTQQLFARLPVALRSYEARSASFSAWILRVARNAALDRVRARRTVPLDDVHASAAWPDDGGLERHACLREALAALPADQRQVVLMRHVLGLTTAEIAGALGRSEGSVHALHHRGRAGLRRRLDDLGIAPATVSSARAVSHPRPARKISVNGADIGQCGATLRTSTSTL
jgi:RNA polymerase sigma-70 factor (ECF subfamily)